LPAPRLGRARRRAAAAAGGDVVATAKAPAAKIVAPPAPPDPKWQALISTSKVSPSLSANLGTTVRKSPEVIQAEEMIQAVQLPKDAPPDQKMAMLAVGGAYAPPMSMGERIPAKATQAGPRHASQFRLHLGRRLGRPRVCHCNVARDVPDFFGPKVLKEPKKQYRVGRLEEFANPGVYEQYKPNEIWVVNLQPSENKLVALNTVCTHLGCIPNWLQGDLKFKCPCHGSGYYITGVNFEGPTPRPLERFAVRFEDGYVYVDKTKIYRSETGRLG
jgi:cytochrome b6-f complex iron-sulfur subunit